MQILADKNQENKSRAAANAVSQKKSGSKSAFQFVDNRPEAIQMRKLQEMANNRPQMKWVAQTADVIQRAVINIQGYDGPQLDTDEQDMAAIKNYLRQLIDAHNSQGVIGLFDQIRQLDEGKLPAIENYREEYLTQLMSPLPQTRDAELLSDALESPIGQRTDHAIPQSIHRFWSGGPLSDSAMETLMESAGKSGGTPWTHTLWYSENFESGIRKTEPPAWKLFGQERDAYNSDQRKISAREEQRRQLRDWGYEIRAIEELVAQGDSSSGVTAEELNRASGMAADSVNFGRGYDDLKYFSDIARLMYLHAEGGHHMDVDIGLGDMDMGQQYYHNDEAGNVPLLGTLARDMSEGGGGQEVVPHLERTRNYRSNPYSGGVNAAENQTSIEQLATRAQTGAGMYNALIASRAGTENIQDAINRIMHSLRTEDPGARNLSTGMGANSELLGGSREREGFAVRRDAGFVHSVPPYLLSLEHLTEESQR